MSNKIIEVGHIGQVASGKFRVAVVDSKTKQIKSISDWKPNLILNSGLAMVGTNTWYKCISRCYAGTGSVTGTNANTTDSGAATAVSDASGNVTVVGSWDFTVQASVGDCILWDTGQQGRITLIGGALTATITPAPGGGGIPAAEFTLCRTSRSTLVTPAKQATSYLTGRPNQEALLTGNVVVTRFTYDFPAETGSVTYTEVGLSAANITPPSAATLFSRLVLPVATALVSGDQLRIIYQLQVAVNPITIQTVTPTISGWTGTSGISGVWNVGLSTSSINASDIGSGQGQIDSLVNEPSSIGGTYPHWVSNQKTGLSGFAFATNAPARTNFPASQVPSEISQIDYTGLTYSQVKSSTWGVGEANQENIGAIKSYGFGFNFFTNPSVNVGLIFEFDNDQFKLNTQTLTLRTKYSWSRTLSIN